MEIHTAHAEPIGEFIREAKHKPFRALACPIGPSYRLAGQKTPIKEKILHWTTYGNPTHGCLLWLIDYWSHLFVVMMAEEGRANLSSFS